MRYIYSILEKDLFNMQEHKVKSYLQHCAQRSTVSQETPCNNCCKITRKISLCSLAHKATTLCFSEHLSEKQKYSAQKHSMRTKIVSSNRN